MTKTSIESLSLSELVAAHNILNPDRPVLHFRNKATGLKRVRDLIRRATPSSIAELERKMPDVDLGLEVGEAASILLDAPNDTLETAMEAIRTMRTTEFIEATQAKTVQKKDGRGRKSSFEGSRIVSTTSTNPRRLGSHGWRSMKIIIESGPDGISYEDFIAAGGRAVDLRWDIAHGNVMVMKSGQ